MAKVNIVVFNNYMEKDEIQIVLYIVIDEFAIFDNVLAPSADCILETRH